MMNVQEHIVAFSELGRILRTFCSHYIVDENHQIQAVNGKPKGQYDEIFLNTIRKSEQNNRWFTPYMQWFSLKAWGDLLTKEGLEKWVQNYTFSNSSKKVAVISAGNIPLVGWHDFLCVLISGHSLLGKTSSKDPYWSVVLTDILIEIDARYQDKIEWTKRLNQFDAVIATGSNNTGQYFEYYFGKKPHIFRKNMSSVAVLDGTESAEDLQALGRDIFTYYGLGCRNVSKIYVPKGYDFTRFLEASSIYSWVYNNNKYANNYDYNQAIYLMNQTPFLQNAFVLLKEDKGFQSPLSVVYYEYYTSTEELNQQLATAQHQIQCLVCNTSLASQIQQDTYRLGEAQTPELNDYADRIDTLQFLSQQI